MFKRRNIRLPYGIALLLVCSFLLFVVPLLPDGIVPLFTRLGFILILILASSLLDDVKRYYFYAAVGLVVLRTASLLLDNSKVSIYIDLMTVVFMVMVSLRLIAQVIKKEASSIVIVEAISGYILLGIAFTTIMGVIVYFDSNSFSHLGNAIEFKPGNNFPLHSYFIFITYTTVGYGDIVPVSVEARTLAKLTALSGQIYIAVVVAILIGKYLQAKD